MPDPESISGGIESDSAALMFVRTEDALEAARRIFFRAFWRRREEPSLWLRGVLIARDRHASLRTESALPAPLRRVVEFGYSDELLDAINVERAGYKGMRLMVDNSLITEALKERMRIPFGRLNLMPLRRLTNSPYPRRLAEFQDFLWMMTADALDWDERKIHMASRLRGAAANPEEFVHAAATQLLFHECNAVFHSVNRALREAE